MQKEELYVSVDEDLCGGCGNYVEMAPDIFTHVNGLSHVKQGQTVLDACEIAVVPVEHREMVIAAAESCPGEIINVEEINFTSNY